jgi:hypothetical protein
MIRCWQRRPVLPPAIAGAVYFKGGVENCGYCARPISEIRTRPS